MTLEELEKVALESIELGLANPGFRVVLPELRYTNKCRIAPGLSGKNLGHYDNKTHVWLDAHKVLKFVNSQKVNSK